MSSRIAKLKKRMPGVEPELEMETDASPMPSPEYSDEEVGEFTDADSERKKQEAIDARQAGERGVLTEADLKQRAINKRLRLR